MQIKYNLNGQEDNNNWDNNINNRINRLLLFLKGTFPRIY